MLDLYGVYMYIISIRNERGRKKMKKYYIVRKDKKSWTSEKVSIEECKTRGFHVQEARRDGDYDMFFDQHKVAILFSNKTEAAQYIGL